MIDRLREIVLKSINGMNLGIEGAPSVDVEGATGDDDDPFTPFEVGPDLVPGVPGAEGGGLAGLGTGPDPELEVPELNRRRAAEAAASRARWPSVQGVEGVSAGGGLEAAGAGAEA